MGMKAGEPACATAGSQSVSKTGKGCLPSLLFRPFAEQARHPLAHHSPLSGTLWPCTLQPSILQPCTLWPCGPAPRTASRCSLQVLFCIIISMNLLCSHPLQSQMRNMCAPL